MAGLHELDADLLQIASEVRSRYFVPLSASELLSGRMQPASAFRPIAQALSQNLMAILTTTCTPFNFSHSATLHRHWDRILAAEKIRSLPLVSDKEAEEEARLRNAHALESARNKFDFWVRSNDGQSVIMRDVLESLKRSLDDSRFSESAEELLRQSLVLTWGAFEVCARDTFVSLLNKKPTLCEKILADPVAKRRFDPSRVPFHVLREYNFDLSASLGTWLGSQQDMSDWITVKCVYEAIFPDCLELKDALEPLRVLSKQRNIIVHRCGLVDVQYEREVGDTQVAGSKIRIDPQKLEQHLRAVVRASECIIILSSAEIELT